MVNPPTEAIRESVQETGSGSGLETLGSSQVFALATVADSFTAWGRNPRIRDNELRQFWPTEPILASTVYSITVRNAAFNWTLQGPPLTVEATQDMLQAAHFGAGWREFMIRIVTDLLSQDNGAFIEVIRSANSADAPVVGLAQLDAARCLRTADPLRPVIYTDRKSRQHVMDWWTVVPLSEFPSPIETMHGIQLCAVSRVLRAAQLLRDISVYQREKISGDNPNAIHLVGGVPSSTITDAMVQHKAVQSERGMTRFVIPLIVASLDPTATVSVDTLDLKSLPDGFDVDAAMKWYINQLALGFGADYQDLAPLPGGNLGTSAQSNVLHSKSRGKGPATFMQMVEGTFNFRGILPRNVTFEYDEQDVEADLEQAELDDLVAAMLERMINTNVLTPEAARQQLLDKGIISQEVFEAQGGTDLTTDIVAQDDDPVDDTTTSDHTGGVRTAARRKPRKKPRRRRHPPGYTAKARGRYARPGVQTARNYDQNYDRLSSLPAKKQDEEPDRTPDPDLPEAFGDPERLDLEAVVEERMAAVLATAFRKARTIMGLPKPKARLFRAKAVPDDILRDAAYWDEFRASAVRAMEPLADQGAKEAVTVNVDLGLSIDLELVNQQVLDFSKRYTSAWWDQLEVSTRNSLRKAIVTWQETGLGNAGLPDLSKALEPTFGRARAKRIAVNEVTQIFDEGNRLAHNSAGIMIEEWQTVEDSKVESICIPLNGQRFPTNSGPRPVTGTHIGCVLPGTRVVATGIERAYRAWYDGPVLELALQGGQRLTVTPNHPVLTPDGWLPAEFLSPGSDIVRGPFAEGEITLGREHIADGPPLIEQVFAALPMVRRVLITASEFHGDGRLMDGDIDIVGADGQLRCACGAAGLQPLHEQHLIGRAVPQAGLVGSGMLGLLLRTQLAPYRRLIGRLGQALTGRGRHLTHALVHSLRTIAGSDASLHQALAYQAPGDSESPTQRQFGFPGLVPRDKDIGFNILPGAAHNHASIPEDAVELSLRDGESLTQVLRRVPFTVRLNKLVSVTRRQYAGHVYDLQTDSSLYQTPGAIVHNCRCARLPVGDDGAVVGGT